MSKAGFNALWPIVLIALLALGALLLWPRGRKRPQPEVSPAAVFDPGATRAPAVVRAQPFAPASVSASNADAVKAALGLQTPRLRAIEFRRTFQAWIDSDPEGALQFLRQMPRGDNFTQGLMLLLETTRRRDVEKALAIAAELVSTREEAGIYSVIFDQLARENASAGASKLALVPAGEGRENALRAVADAWVRSDRAAALAWAQGLLDPADREVALETSLGELAAVDPLQAIDLAQKSLHGAELDRTVFSALQKLSETDPRNASGLVALLPPGNLQTLAAADVGRKLADQTISAAVAWAESLPAGETRAAGLHSVIASWIRTDSSAAANYVAQLPPGVEQDATLSEVGTALAIANPTAALTWAQSLSTEAMRQTAVASAVSGWAQNDAPAATRWAAALGPGVVQSAALSAGLSYWLIQDKRSAESFVETLSGPAQVVAAGTLAPELAQENGAAAMNWAQSLGSAEARDVALAAAYTRWVDNDPAAAQKWLQSTALAPEIKAKIASRK